jgi:hypothetical protein
MRYPIERPCPMRKRPYKRHAPSRVPHREIVFCTCGKMKASRKLPLPGAIRPWHQGLQCLQSVIGKSIVRLEGSYDWEMGFRRSGGRSNHCQIPVWRLFSRSTRLSGVFLKGISWWEKGGSKENKSRFYPRFMRYLPSNFTTHATMLVKDSLNLPFSLPHSGHFAFFLC